MCKYLEHLTVYHCAPTLAGLKMANLFCCSYASAQALETGINNLKHVLGAKGLKLKVIKSCSKKCQIYIYRQHLLLKALQQDDVAMFLQKYNYPKDVDMALEHLKTRFSSCEDFPHELGIFLGYPLNDVLGFIKHGGKNFVCAGCWKAYHNGDKAKKLFNTYNKCRQVYIKCYENGMSISKLTVA